MEREHCFLLLVERKRQLIATSLFIPGKQFFIYLTIRFHTVDGINRECKVEIQGERGGTFQITNEMLENATLQCPMGTVFDWSPYEYSINRKLWWTAVIEEKIQISRDHVLTIMYIFISLIY